MIEYLGLEALEPFVAYATPRVDQAARDADLRAWCARLLEIAGKGDVVAE
jgi:NAD(P)H dehydrogenase (quinone)